MRSEAAVCLDLVDAAAVPAGPGDGEPQVAGRYGGASEGVVGPGGGVGGGVVVQRGPGDAVAGVLQPVLVAAGQLEGGHHGGERGDLAEVHLDPGRVRQAEALRPAGGQVAVDREPGSV